MLDQLQQHGILSQQKGYDGRGALYLASDNGNYDAASLLVSRGHRFAAIDFSGRSAFQVALGCYNPRLRHLAIDFSGKMCVMSASYSSPILVAYCAGDAKATKSILQKAKKAGCARFIDDVSEIHLPALAEAAMRNDTTFLDFLLVESANNNPQWRGEGPSLKLAYNMGHLEVVKRLVESGADTTWTGSSGTSETAVYAARYHEVSKWLHKQVHGPQTQDVSDNIEPSTPSRPIMPPLPLSKVHRHIRKRASFELEYARRRRDVLATLGIMVNTDTRDNIQPSASSPENKVLASSVAVLTQYNMEFRQGQFRKRAWRKLRELISQSRHLLPKVLTFFSLLEPELPGSPSLVSFQINKPSFLLSAEQSRLFSYVCLLS
jgi:hypothetical protein